MKDGSTLLQNREIKYTFRDYTKGVFLEKGYFDKKNVYNTPTFCYQLKFHLKKINENPHRMLILTTSK